jgi:hypothetical protein
MGILIFSISFIRLLKIGSFFNLINSEGPRVLLWLAVSIPILSMLKVFSEFFPKQMLEDSGSCFSTLFLVIFSVKMESVFPKLKARSPTPPASVLVFVIDLGELVNFSKNRIFSPILRIFFSVAALPSRSREAKNF